ncbi:HAD family phosphatase [Candidatus Pacearchaeota archaeon]|nr:HAD family phosphatase [Candidatus Pacearchaeota archaeon]
MNNNQLAVIFDMDGVIAYTLPFHVKAWKRLCNNHNEKFPDDFFENYLGLTSSETVKRFFNNQLSPELVNEYTKEKDRLYLEEVEVGLKPMKGLIKLLDELSSNHIPLAVATSEPSNVAKIILKSTGVSKYFPDNAILTGDQVTKSKPSPEIYLKTARILGIDPKQCIAIEDSIPGLESAINADMKTIALTSSHPKEELSHADLVIESFDELTLEKIKSLVKF